MVYFCHSQLHACFPSLFCVSCLFPFYQHRLLHAPWSIRGNPEPVWSPLWFSIPLGQPHPGMDSSVVHSPFRVIHILVWSSPWAMIPQRYLLCHEAPSCRSASPATPLTVCLYMRLQHFFSLLLTHVSLHISSGVSFCMSSCSLTCLLIAPHTPHCCCPFLNVFEQQWHRLPCLLQHWGPGGCFHWLPSWSRAAHGLPSQPLATQTLPDMPNT